MSVPEPKLVVETVYRLLQTRSRRRALRCLSREQEMTLAELARAVSAESRDGGSVEETKIRLHHVDLPKLAENEVVEYDEEKKTVSLLATGRRLVSYLDDSQNR